MAKKPPTKAKSPAKPRPVDSPAPLVEQPHGGALVAGGYGQGGRPKEVLRRLCREQVLTRRGAEFVGSVMDGSYTEEEVLVVGTGKDARLVVRDVHPKIKDRLLAFELLSDRGFGKPDQAVHIKDDEAPRRTGEETMRRIMELLPRVVAVLPVERQELARLLAQRRQVEVLVQGKDVTVAKG